MKLLSRSKPKHVDPMLVPWPQYCLGVVPCGRFELVHESHFWLHPSGFWAVCEGADHG